MLKSIILTQLFLLKVQFDGQCFRIAGYANIPYGYLFESWLHANVPGKAAEENGLNV